MPDKNIACNPKVVRAMTQVVLNDILNSVINEFEKKVGTNIGAIKISPRKRGQRKREINIEVKRATDKCLDGLVQYKKILCDHDPLIQSASGARHEH